MMRYARQNKILDLIRTYEVGTQEKLAKLLRTSGFKVTQATVSRDIRELQLVKAVSENGKSCYAIPSKVEAPVSDRFKKILKETIQNIESAENIIVIKTLSGCANAAGEAIDTSDYPEIIGTIAGDNTMLVIVDKKENVPKLLETLRELIL
ncbi:MAG: arginine repressor [Clostridia bacterium]|nr:arginine repressor [Clostridia bacterium]